MYHWVMVWDWSYWLITQFHLWSLVFGNVFDDISQIFFLLNCILSLLFVSQVFGSNFRIAYSLTNQKAFQKLLLSHLFVVYWVLANKIDKTVEFFFLNKCIYSHAHANSVRGKLFTGTYPRDIIRTACE